MSHRTEKLDSWLRSGGSVILFGRPGVGKTGLSLETFKRNGLVMGKSVAYYSPHANDLIGNLNEAIVIFFDDLGGDLKAQQAAMEVLSLKVWRGHPLPMVRNVWACTQPVILTEFNGKIQEPAVFDHFRCKTTIPYKPDMGYFVEKYGEPAAKAAIEWWDQLDEETKMTCSPRRLDLGLQTWVEKGDIRDVIPVIANVSKLYEMLNSSKPKSTRKFDY